MKWGERLREVQRARGLARTADVLLQYTAASNHAAAKPTGAQARALECAQVTWAGREGKAAATDLAPHDDTVLPTGFVL